MRLKSFALVLTASACALFGIFTITNYGVRLDRLTTAAAQTEVQSSPNSGDNSGPTLTPAKPAVAKAVKASIIAQLNAFKKDDYAKASIYQSSLLRQNFTSADAFRSMMKTQYPEFASYKSISFGPIETTSDKKAVEAAVKLTGTDGYTVAAVYLMIMENGLYRVAGVQGGASPHPIVIPMDPAVS